MKPVGGGNSFYQRTATVVHHSPELLMRQDLLTHSLLRSYSICARSGEVGQGKVWELAWQKDNINPGSFV